MNYGHSYNPTILYFKGRKASQEQISWAKQHESTGVYSYQTYGIMVAGTQHVKWQFTHKADAVLFALKFK